MGSGTNLRIKTLRRTWKKCAIMSSQSITKDVMEKYNSLNRDQKLEFFNRDAFISYIIGVLQELQPARIFEIRRTMSRLLTGREGTFRNVQDQAAILIVMGPSSPEVSSCSVSSCSTTESENSGKNSPEPGPSQPPAIPSRDPMPAASPIPLTMLEEEEQEPKETKAEYIRNLRICLRQTKDLSQREMFAVAERFAEVLMLDDDARIVCFSIPDQL